MGRLLTARGLLDTRTGRVRSSALGPELVVTMRRERRADRRAPREARTFTAVHQERTGRGGISPVPY